MNAKKIVITGGPSTGKTSVIHALEQKGFRCFHELIRTMTLEKKEQEDASTFKTNPIVSVANPLAFNQNLLKGRIAQFEAASTLSSPLVFIDRGIPDVLAYMDCFDQKYGPDFEQACKTYRYDHVFIMPPWKEIHVSDEERFETFEESIVVNHCLMQSYIKYGYNIQVIPKGTVDERVDFIIAQLYASS